MPLPTPNGQSNSSSPKTGGKVGLPSHIGLIMDGNGRWALKRGLPRFEGHRRGVEALRQAVKLASELGIKYLTVYSFSSENWSRPKEEIQDLMNLLKKFIRDDLENLRKSDVNIRIIGDREDLNLDIRNLLIESEDATKENKGLNLQIAFNYGGRQEIARAVRRIAKEVQDGHLALNQINPSLIETFLDTVGVPDPDLIIRTSGEQRLSNFLLWQSAYSEFVFLPMNWPEFNRAAFELALGEYTHRKRRFGGLNTVEAVE